MRTKIGIGPWAGAIALSLAALYCGGDDTNGDTTTSGTGGAGGSSTTSSTAGAGGSSTTSTTATATTTGTSGAAGQGGSTGSGGSPGTGGSTSVSCPASPPSGTCSVQGGYCSYGGAYCFCDQDTSGALRWFCFSGDAGTSVNCPAQKPTPGTACPTTELAYCHYDGPSVCVCNGRGGGGNKGWVCY